MVRYAHDMIFPELIKENANPVVDLQGRLIAGPDRRYDSPMMKWQMWKKAVEFADKIEPVHHKIKMYYEKYKHLSRPPKEGEEVIPPAQEGVSVSLTKPFKAPRFTWSYTSLQEFLTCPAQWAAKRYYKTVVEKESEAMRVGNLIHATAEHYLKAKIGEPHDINQINPDYLPMVQPYCDAIRAAHAAGAEVYVEHEFCYTNKFEPCGWKDWNTVWVRGKGDVLVKNDNKISIIDWKSGRYKEDFLQLKLFAVLAALQPQFKDVQEFDPKFIFTKEAAPKNILKLDKPIQRSELKSVLAEILVNVRRMEAAWESENFPARRNFLCRSWCYNTDCAHCGG